MSLIVCRTHHGACVVFKPGFIYDCGEKNQTLEPVSPQYLGLDCTLHKDMWAGDIFLGFHEEEIVSHQICVWVAIVLDQGFDVYIHVQTRCIETKRPVIAM